MDNNLINTHITERSQEEDKAASDSLINKEDWPKESAKSYTLKKDTESKHTNVKDSFATKRRT